MKKITFTFIALLTSILSMAQNGSSQRLFSVQNARLPQKSLRSLVKVAQSKSVLPIVSDVIIKEQPEGEFLENLQRKAFCTVPGGIGLEYVPQTCAVGNYLKGKDGNLYIYNALGRCYTFSFLKLEPSGGNSYVLRTPQAIDTDYDSEGKTINLYATRLKLQTTNDGLAYVPEMTEKGEFVGEVKFEFKDGILTQESEGADDETGLPKVIIALTTAEGEWQGFSTADIVIKPFNETATTAPEDLKTSPYILKYLSAEGGMKSHVVEAAFQGNDFYLKSPFQFGNESTPEMWIKGAKEGSKIVFKPQYMGLNDEEHNYVFMKPAVYGFKDTEDGDQIMIAENADELVFDIEEGTGKLTCNEKGLMLINEGLEYVRAWDAYADPVFTPFVDKAYTPADPSDIELDEYDENDGQPVMFNIKKEDVDGNYILPEQLYYNVYFDTDESPYTFDTETYSDLEEDLTDIPVDYEDGMYFFLKDNRRMFYTAVKDFKRVGIQMIYKGGGDTKRSKIVWYEKSTDGISTYTSAPVRKIEYFDICGRRLSQPAKGIGISRITYSDGKQEIIKSLKH